MNFSEDQGFKHWPATLAVLMIGLSFWWLNKSWNTEIPVSPEELSYEMPRPKSMGPDYDISGRKAVLNEPSAPTGKGLVANLPVGKSVMTAPPAAAATVAKKADAKKTAQNQKKKAQVQLRVVEATRHGLSISPAAAGAAETTAMAPYQGQSANTKAKADAVATESDSDKRTAGQWKALLAASPTAANASEFYKAYRSGDVTAADFYTITEDQLKSTGAERQKQALLILKMDYSAKSFSILVGSYTNTTPDSLKTAIYALLKTYGEASHLGVLARVLYSTDQRVLTMATQILSATIAAQGSSTAGDGRSPGSSTAIPKSSFQAFLPALRRLAQSGNATLAQQAQSLLTSIEAMKVA